MKKYFSFIAFAIMTALSLTFVSCGSDDESNNPNQTMTVGSVYAIPGGSTGWTSDNKFIASVSANGVTAEHVGETYIRNGSKSFKVTVISKYNTFKEPCLQWHADKPTVRNYMRNYVIQSETDDHILYKGLLKELFTFYTFKNGKLYGSSVLLSPSVVDAEELSDFLIERYVYVTKNDEDYYIGFVTPDTKSFVIMQITTINSEVVYHVAYGEATSNSAPAQVMNMLKQQFTPESTSAEAKAKIKAEFLRLIDVMPEINTELNLVK